MVDHDLGRRVRLLAHVHLYPPTHNAGAEWMLHAILERLAVEHDVECRVITNRPPHRNDRLGPVSVSMARDGRSQQNAHRWADVVITHLDATRQAMMMVRRTGTPLVHLVHNDQQLAYHKVSRHRAQLVVFNSQWISDAHPSWPGDSMIVHPPVWHERYTQPVRSEPHDSVTLLNVAEAKGGPLFYELARRMPDVKFLGVRGAYATQTAPPQLANLEVIPNQRNAAEVYARTKLLVMPSTYESWGRCAIEAGFRGVPSIAGDTPGLQETGVPCVFLDPSIENVDEWELHVRRLLDDVSHRHEQGRAACARAYVLEQLCKEQVDDLACRLRAMTSPR